MPNTVNLSIYTAAFPAITVHDLKYVVYKSADFPAEEASQTFSPPHGARTVSFPGLERTNYIWKLIEMDGATPVLEKASFNVVPDGDTDIEWKPPIEIEADVTPNFSSGTNTFTFDTPGSDMDWRGWDIYVDRVGQGTMKKNTQYSWDSVTGTFTLLLAGDEFQPNELFNVEFGIKQRQSSGGIPAISIFAGTMIVTGTTTLVAGDIGKKIIIKGASPYFEITLPDISLVTASKLFYFESGIGSHKCVKIKTASGQLIDWMKGSRTDVKIGVCEDIAIYRETGTTNWRVHNANGNFLSVGRIIVSDADPVDEFNAVLMDGSSLSTSDYARLYEDFVQQLPPAQVCNFADWGTGTNRYKFSYASGGVFKVPDRRNLYVRNTDGSLLPGVYQADAAYIDPVTTGLKGVKYTGTNTGTSFDNSVGEINNREGFDLQGVSGVTETRPKTVISRMFVLV